MNHITIPSQGYELAADWYDGDNGEVLLVLVGYASSKQNYQDMITAIVEQTGTSALVLDYRGHGESPLTLGEVSPEQNLADVLAAYDWIAATYPNAVINVMGTSYGGFLGVQLLAARKIHNLVLRAPAIYRPEELSEPWSTRLANEAAYRSTARVYRTNKDALREHPLFAAVGANLSGRALVMVHEYDELVPHETTDAYVHALNADAHMASGFMHAFNSGSPEDKAVYVQEIITWLQQHRA